MSVWRNLWFERVLQMTLEQLAQRIRTLRERKGIRQEAFAEACGISVSFASLLERGERSPSYETLVSVAAALNVSLAELLSSEEKPQVDRLQEFVRSTGLSEAQVERLIAVAQAMFGPELEPPQVLCSEPECQRPVLSKGLCAAHYHRIRRAHRPNG